MEYAFITGGLGLIGSQIARNLIENKVVDKVVCLDHYGRYVDSTKSGFTDYRKFRIEGIEDSIIIERGEAKFFSVLFTILMKYKPKYIFHLAALPLAKINNLNSQEALEGTVQSTTNMIEIISHMEDYAPERFVYTSSSMVYGDFVQDIATEEHPTNPKEIYGTMKLAGENVTRGLCGFYKIPYTIIRPSAVYGPTDMNRRVSQIFIEKAFRDEQINIQGKDEALDFTYVKDTAMGFVLAATHKAGINETFNITYGKAHTLYEFVTCLQKHFPDLDYVITERDAFRPKRGTLSIEKARKLLGYDPVYSLEKGIDEYIRFIKKYKNELG